MSVTGGIFPSAREWLSQVDRVAGSSVLKGSESLCKLLRYLAEHALEHPGAVIKEYQIATEVFGRAPGFDPRLDATVRVQTGRLRSKLAEYYAVEGAEDQLILDLPKGAYSLSLHLRPHAEMPPTPAPVSSSTENVSNHTAAPASPMTAPLWVLSCLCVLLVVAVVYVVQRRPALQAAAAQPSRATKALETFWHGFVDGPETPIVVFSNAEFIGRPETGMRYFDPAKDSRDAILDHYTGIGEVLAIHELDRVFTQLNHSLRVKRGRLLSLDDAQDNDLIFVGSPSENLTLRVIPNTQDFVFRLAEDGPRKGDLGIVNVKPHPGEEPLYMGTKTVPITEDYAVIALVPGKESGRWVIILAGTTTIGTEAAVEYVCRERDLSELESKVGVSRSGVILPFEAVIRLKVAGGVPLSTQLVALRVTGK